MITHQVIHLRGLPCFRKRYRSRNARSAVATIAATVIQVYGSDHQRNMAVLYAKELRDSLLHIIGNGRPGVLLASGTILYSLKRTFQANSSCG